MSFKFNLLDTVRCKVSGFTGTVTARVDYAFTTNRYGLTAEAKDGKPSDNWYLEEAQLELIAPAPTQG